MKILFYCHFPDLLLATNRSTIHSLYRAPLDYIEESSTGGADMILVNSAFTRRIFSDTFTRLNARHIIPSILYPAVHPPTDVELEQARTSWRSVLPLEAVELIESGPTFLSINRFERKKGIPLAIQSLAQLLKNLNIDPKKDKMSGPKLIIAGGYDARLPENVKHLEELEKDAMLLGLRERIVFLPSFTDAQRSSLLAACTAVLYTPQGEHFGIVPLEAMAAGKPTIACNSGGPLESIAEGDTGYLRPPKAEEWAKAMETLMDEEVAGRFGRQARQHVLSNFSRTTFGNRLNEMIIGLVAKKDD